MSHYLKAVADPGFPVGGGGVATSDVGVFWRKHMSKRKNWLRLGGGGGRPPGSANSSR